jgi:hypothetical protein
MQIALVLNMLRVDREVKVSFVHNIVTVATYDQSTGRGSLSEKRERGSVRDTNPETDTGR